MRFQTKISKTGPLFEHDPEKTFAENARTMLEAVAEEGQADARARSQAHRKTGAFEGGIHGRVESLHGKDWYRNAVISQQHVYPWGNHRGGRSQAQYRGGRLEARYHIFSATARALRAARAVNAAELTKGIS